MFLVAIILASVPQIFSTITSPTLIGEVAVTLSNSFIISKIFPFGIGLSVLTGSLLKLAPVIFTVEVTTLTGFVTSLIPYSFPRGQAFQVTCFFSSSTLRWQPRGQQIQISSFIISSPLLRRRFHLRHLLTYLF